MNNSLNKEGNYENSPKIGRGMGAKLRGNSLKVVENRHFFVFDRNLRLEQGCYRPGACESRCSDVLETMVHSKNKNVI